MGLTRTRSATAGGVDRGLQEMCFHKVKRGNAPASGWLHRLVRRKVRHLIEFLGHVVIWVAKRFPAQFQQNSDEKRYRAEHAIVEWQSFALREIDTFAVMNDPQINPTGLRLWLSRTSLVKMLVEVDRREKSAGKKSAEKDHCRLAQYSLHVLPGSYV